MKSLRLTIRSGALLAALIVALAAGGWYVWQGNQSTLPEGLAFGNGRIEADQIDISAKSAGRLRNVLVQEGDLVSAGQTLAQIDATELEAQRAKYLADETAEEASMLEAEALVAQREAEYKLREANLQRALALVDKAAVSIQSRDQAQSERDASRAALEAAKTNVIARERSIQAAKALVALIEAQIADATLKSPVKGRVLYRLAKTGEVVGAGGKVLTIIDLSEVYMEIYLPAQQAMQVPIGSEARIQFDRVDFAVPAIVSFVSPEAQFTPKQVETLDERNNLMFRVKLRVPQELVDKHIDQAKSGTRGVGYVRLGSNPPDWPEFLERRFPGETSEIEGQ